MNPFTLFPLLGTPDAAAAASGGGAGALVSSLIPFVLIIGIFYFLIIRPQNKKQKDTQKMLAALKKGDRITTIGGIHGTIQSVKENTVIVRVDENAKMEFSRSAISSVDVVAKEEKAEKLEGKKEEKADADNKDAKDTDK
ncbi:MAG: preprotein translocase subunit YajC [Treponema sp.]|nr:preprotein translocase subunit YajC [Treponema sp.]